MKRLFYSHPFLFAAFFVISLAANNVGQVSMRSFTEAILAMLVSVLFLYAATTLLTGKQSFSALFASTCVIFFMSYGHVENVARLWMPTFLTAMRIMGRPVGINSLLMPVWAVLFGCILILIWRYRASLAPVHRWATTMSSILVVLSTLLYSANAIRGGEFTPADPWADQPLDTTHWEVAVTPPPDIYYLILDGYAPERTIKKLVPAEGRTFIEDDLRQRGFYVATASQANYLQTMLSLPSALNMNYFDQLPGEFNPENFDPTPAHHLTQNSLLINILKRYGYRYIHFSSGWQSTFENPHADQNIAYPLQLRRFHRALAETTLLKPFMYIASSHFYRQALLYNFEHLKDMPGSSEQPLFVFAHIVAPHPPYVFDAHCQPIASTSSWQPVEKYVDMTECVRAQAIGVVDTILKNSPRQPIIIIQSDHGSKTSNQFVVPYEQLSKEAVEEASGILNAYYLPGEAEKRLYPSISPINTWRVVLNAYFGANFEVVPDRTFWSETYSPYRFIDIL